MKKLISVSGFMMLMLLGTSFAAHAEQKVDIWKVNNPSGCAKIHIVIFDSTAENGVLLIWAGDAFVGGTTRTCMTSLNTEVYKKDTFYGEMNYANPTVNKGSTISTLFDNSELLYATYVLKRERALLEK